MGASGLALPVRGFRGRIVLSSGDVKVKEDVLLAVSDGESANPWNDDVGIVAPVFGLDSPATRALTLKRIRERFKKLETEDRAKLSSVDFKKTTEGELEVRVSYVDLETDDELEATSRLSRG